MKSKKKSVRYQQGGTSLYNYDKSGNTNITPQEAQMLANNTGGMGLQFTPEFASEYFSKNTVLPTPPPPKNYSTMPIVDITSDGQFTDRKVWRTQHPEWFVGKQEPVEGKDYTIVPHKQWKEYQNSPEYSIFRKKATQLATLQYGGDYYNANTPYFMQNPGTTQNVPQPTYTQQYSMPQQQNIYNPQSTINFPPNQGYQMENYSQNFAQNLQANNPIPNNFSQYGTPPAELPTQQVNPLATDAGSGYQTDENGNRIQDSYDKTRFAQIYGGFDIPSAAYKLGQGIETGNAFDIGVSGLKLATGLGRNIVSGIGQANRRGYVLDEYNKDVRNTSRPNPIYGQNGGYFQDGGEQQIGQQAPPPQDQMQQMAGQVASALQQGADPQQILQQLVQNGIPQDQATQLITAVMQQLQGAPQEEQAEGQSNMQEESQEMQMGGTSKKKVDGTIDNPNYLQEGRKANGEIVAELEGAEQVKTPDGQIKEVIGDSHAQGGVKVTEEQLPNGSQILSDHLEVGKAGAKKFNEDYDLGVKSTDTYAKVIDKFNSKSGIKKINEEQEIVLKNIEKQTKKLEDNPASASTIKLNLQLFTDQHKELEEQKAPLVEARRVLFDQVFHPQEESKETGHNVEEAQKPIPQEQGTVYAQNGGMFDGDMIMEYAQKHNLHPDKVREIMQQHANGGIQQYQYGTTVDPFLQNSTLISNFPNTPAEIGGLPYTPRETNPNTIWQGVNYENVWKPLVEKSLADPEQAKKIDNWLTENKGTFSPNVQKQLEGLSGDARIEKIKTLATDKFPGLFHNAVLDAIKATTPVNEETSFDGTGYTVSGATGRTKYVLPNLPDQSPLLPDSLQGALKQVHRYDRVEAPLASPDQAITEIRRQEQSAMQGLQNLPDAQKAAAIAQIQANTQNALNQTIAQTTGANQQAKYNADVTNAQIQMREEDMRNKDLTDYEAKILKADANTQRDLRNYYNNAQKVNLTNFNSVNGLNLVNDRYDNAYFTGQGTEYGNLQKAGDYGNVTPKTKEQQIAELKAQIVAEKKLETKSKKRFGGTK